MVKKRCVAELFGAVCLKATAATASPHTPRGGHSFMDVSASKTAEDGENMGKIG